MKCFLLFLLISSQSFGQGPIEKNEFITIGGIKQYVRIKGKDMSKPILLFCMEAPGSSVMRQADQMTGKLQQQFVVVHWGQRETGETFRLNKSSQPLTLNLFYNDTHEMIDSLLKRFRRPKLYLACYSWGSAPGFHIAGKYQGLLYAYIAISPAINQWESEKIALEMLKEKRNKRAQKRIGAGKDTF